MQRCSCVSSQMPIQLIHRKFVSGTAVSVTVLPAGTVITQRFFPDCSEPQLIGHVVSPFTYPPEGRTIVRVTDVEAGTRLAGCVEGTLDASAASSETAIQVNAKNRLPRASRRVMKLLFGEEKTAL